MAVIRFVVTVGEDQVIRPPSGVLIPGGAVEVVIQPIGANPASTADDEMAATRAWLLALAAETEATAQPLPVDMAIHHDYYAHGKPLP